MMWVGLECNQPRTFEVVDDPLHVSAAGAHVASEPGDRLRAFGSDDSGEDLPARARWPKARYSTICFAPTALAVW
jgi:hypothetical protein